MFTNIKKVTNSQWSVKSGVVAFANNQPDHKNEGWACVPLYSAEVGRFLPIPQTNDFMEGLWISTEKGCCKVIDRDWTISGQWENGTIVVLLDKNKGAGGDVEVVISAEGEISMNKAP